MHPTIVLVAFSFGGAQEKTTSLALGSLNKIYQPFLGKWTNSLQSDERVNLPTWLEVNPSVDGKSLEFRRTWDDGPNRFVKELSRIHIAPQKKTFADSSARGKSEDVYGTLCIHRVPNSRIKGVKHRER